MNLLPVIKLNNVTKQFSPDGPSAINQISARIPGGKVTGLVGPDGAGKTTLLRLIAGLLVPDAGNIKVGGCDPTDRGSTIHQFVSYMPQKFGLYEDLTVMENLNLYGDLRGVTGVERRMSIEKLLSFTSLCPFISRPAGKLSGGMKQKLGLACSLIQRPKILLLDEPSVGVDPLSRRELWQMVYELVGDGITVVWSTAYLDEAERCFDVLVLNEGQLLYQGPPSELTLSNKGRTFLVTLPENQRRQFASRALQDPRVIDSVIQGQSVRLIMREPIDSLSGFGDEFKAEPCTPRFEDAFMSLLGGVPKDRALQASGSKPEIRNGDDEPGEVVVEARGLTKKFGIFTAADKISFQVRKGEVFGLLGPNGAGKSTTFKMLCGLLKPTSGDAKVAGIDLLKAPAQARERMGYMAQKFSLYGDLSVRQNLVFFGGVYGLVGQQLDKAVQRTIEEFQLNEFVETNAGELPLGFKQRLSMACATMHQPQILFLDEPTSGVDPITRREFWVRINAMVERGVAVIVTTHFMDEAEYCDRVALIYQGRMIATDTPDGIKKSTQSDHLPEPTLEDAFITLIERNMHETAASTHKEDSPKQSASTHGMDAGLTGGKLLRILSLVRKETYQIIRDPSSLIIAFVLPLMLLFLFGFGVSLDLSNVPIGVVIEKQSPQARSLLFAFQSSRYFTVQQAQDRRQLEPLLVGGRLGAVVIIPAEFAKQLQAGHSNPLQVLVRGTEANTGELVLNYIEGAWRTWLIQEGLQRGQAIENSPISIHSRVWFNEEVESNAAILPGSIAVIMTLIGTMLTSLVIAREWERGTMEALLATPVTRFEILLGKFIPYFMLGMSALALVTVTSTQVMGIPFRGSLWALTIVSAVFLSFALGLGMLISTVTRNQFVASQISLIVGFLPSFLLSGLVFEIGSMPMAIRILTRFLPPRYFVSSLQTLFLAGDIWPLIMPNTLIMAGFAVFFLGMTARKTAMKLG